MASPGQLVERVASALGIELSTVVTHDRNLVGAGLRAKGGRGSSAARMSAYDAANLLIAATGAEQVQASVRAVENFGGLIVVGSRPDTPLHGLRAGHTFGEALAAFIQAFTDDKFRGADALILNFEMIRPVLKASITGVIHDREIEAVYRPSARDERGQTGDLRTITHFTQATIGQIGQILRS